MTYLQKKKRHFLSIVNKVKGFVRSIVGTSPLMIEDCVDDNSIINYNILGNTTQNGVPSYDNCVDFESVGDLVTEYDGGKNLLNPDRNIQRFRISEQGIIEYSANWNYTEAIKIEADTTYTVSFVCIKDSVLRIHEFNSDRCWIGQNTVFTTTAEMINNKISVTFTTSAESCYVRLSYISANYSEMQLEKGEATKYEPYHAEKYGKYRIPITASGKNLLDLSGINYYNSSQKVRYTSENGYLKLNGTKYGAGWASFKKGTEEEPLFVLEADTYAFSVRVISGTYTYNDIAIQLNTGKMVYINNTTVFTLTEPLVVTQIRGYIGKDNNIISDLVLAIQLEKSNKATEFQPYFEPIETEIYLDEPLRQGIYYDFTNNKVVPYTGYEDYIDFENQKIVRKIVETEVYWAGNDYNGQGNTPSVQGRTFSGFAKGIYRYQALGGNYGYLRWASDPCTILYMEYADYGVTSKTELQTYLNTCALADKPVKVVYRRATPVEIPFELPKLPSYKGDVIYTIGTTITPEVMSATYYSYTNPSIHSLPSEYQEVSYIEGTGTQYIDTEFYPSNNKYIMTAKIKSSVVPKTTEDKYYRVFGNLSAENPSGTTLYRYQYRGYNSSHGAPTDAVCCGTAVDGEARALYTWQNDTDYEITVDGINKMYSVNDKTANYSGKAASYVSNYSIKLFTVSTTSARDSMKFYNFKVKDETGNLVVNLYPCYRRSDNVIGMYDVIRGRFFVNAGTEVFLKGENV